MRQMLAIAAERIMETETGPRCTTEKALVAVNHSGATCSVTGLVKL